MFVFLVPPSPVNSSDCQKPHHFFSRGPHNSLLFLNSSTTQSQSIAVRCHNKFLSLPLAPVNMNLKPVQSKPQKPTDGQENIRGAASSNGAVLL